MRREAYRAELFRPLRVASASRSAIAFSEVGTDDPAHLVQSVFPVKAAYAGQSLPLGSVAAA